MTHNGNRGEYTVQEFRKWKILSLASCLMFWNTLLLAKQVVGHYVQRNKKHRIRALLRFSGRLVLPEEGCFKTSES